MKHELKILPQYFQAVKNGTKTFEVRKNDRGFQNGDEVTLREWDPETRSTYEVGGYTGDYMDFKIGYVFMIDAERVVFSLIAPPSTASPIQK